MIKTQNNGIPNKGGLLGVNFPLLQAAISNDRDVIPALSNSLFVDIDQAVGEMLMKMESAEFIEENY